ncbi:kelch domain-containing protein 2-like isoform X2 [Gigantopelta aegis]|uniref:kelch domain-containing protein 2-like isoform X2 n=1 Tax=Gigantopelta aegis TaxID=1735272 RepID=UPI001B88C55E|nr:kelch domain-containing protein 2-like isoform X2 [Gigantopelta aegis]
MQAYIANSDVQGLIPMDEEIPPRSGHVAACVGNKLLVWGGYQDENEASDRYLPVKDVWLYSVEFNKWTKQVTSGQYPPGLSGASSCILDKYWYILFGHMENGNMNMVYRLNLQTFCWETREYHSTEPSPRDKTSVWVYKDKIYCFAGFGPPVFNSEYLCDYGEFFEDPTIQWSPIRSWNNQLLVFDPQTWEWSNPKCKGFPPVPRAAHGAALAGSKLFVFGGRHDMSRRNDLHCLDMTSLTWSGELNPLGDIPCGRSWHAFRAISNSKVLLYGGYTTDQRPLGDAWLLDVVALQWTRLDILQKHTRLWHTMDITSSGDIVIFGGCSNDILRSDLQSRHVNEVVLFRIEPKTLLRCCLEMVFKHKEKTKPYWKMLPTLLQQWLCQRLHAQNTSPHPALHIQWLESPALGS